MKFPFQTDIVSTVKFTYHIARLSVRFCLAARREISDLGDGLVLHLSLVIGGICGPSLHRCRLSSPYYEVCSLTLVVRLDDVGVGANECSRIDDRS